MSRRNTPTKEAVLNLLLNSRKALSQDAIEKQLDIKINRATIAPSPFFDLPKLLLKVSPGIPVLIENPLGPTEPYFDL